MKLTKKAAALLLAASLAVSVCATPVFATGTIGPNLKPNVQQDGGVKVSGTETGSQEAHMKLEYDIETSYVWRIPADVNFGKDESLNEDIVIGGKADVRKVEVGECHIPKNTMLKIKIEGNDGGEDKPTAQTRQFKIKSVEGQTLEYEVWANDTNNFGDTSTGARKLGVGVDVLSIAPGEKSETKYLQFILKTKDDRINTSVYAGSYVGYAVFTAELKP